MGDYLAPGQVHIGSVLDLAGRLEPGSVQCLVTSPPYWNLRSYLDSAHPDKAKELGSEATVEEYVENMVAVFRALRPALKDSATAWLNLGDAYANDGKWGGATGGKHAAGIHGQTGIGRQKVRTGLPPKSLLMVPHRVALALQAEGWIIRQDCVWSKPNPMPESVTDRPTRSHEYLFLIAKGPRYFYDAEAIKEPVTGGTHPKGPKNAPPKSLVHADSRERVKNNASFTAAIPDMVTSRNKRSVWEVSPAQFADAHYATFAPDLIRPCVLAGTSAAGECANCGRAWVRVVEREKVGQLRPYTATGGRHATYAASHGTPNGEDRTTLNHVYAAQTTGWRPQCSCPPGTPTRPQIVLDPFAGSCTTWEVAHEEGRRFIGFDLDERAVEWGRQRLAKLPVGRLFA